MFKKKICKRCGKKNSSKNKFCSNCGYKLDESLEEHEEDYGMLGKNDYLETPETQVDMLSKAFFNSINSGILGKMLGNALKMLEKEMQKAEKQEIAKTNFELYINGKKINPENIKFNKNNNVLKPKKSIMPSFMQKNFKKISNLPRKEPHINMKRISDEVIYEMDIPGVKSIEDIIISKLENSIEVKAIAKDKVYTKLIPVNLPIKKYNFLKDKLILYLDAK